MANKPKEELRATVELNLSGRKLEYALATILGIGGYGVYNINDSGQEVNRVDFMTLQHDVKELKVNMKLFSTMLSEENRKLIEKKK